MKYPCTYNTPDNIKIINNYHPEAIAGASSLSFPSVALIKPNKTFEDISDKTEQEVEAMMVGATAHPCTNAIDEAQNLNDALVASPNPTNGFLKLSIADYAKGEYEVEIVNILGEVLFRDFFNGSTYAKTYDLNNFEKGVYFVKVYKGNTAVYKKIILQH